jgi:hypothetical protein
MVGINYAMGWRGNGRRRCFLVRADGSKKEEIGLRQLQRIPQDFLKLQDGLKLRGTVKLKPNRKYW